MKQILGVLFILLVSQQAYTQHVYQIRADSVRIYNVCDTAELIIENRTRGVAGFLFNKGNGRTEFRRLQLESIGGNQIAISGQDTLDISTLPGIGGVDTIYRDGDNIKYSKRGMLYSLYAPLPQFYEIPTGTAYSFSQYLPNRLTAFNAYISPDMPMFSDQALTNTATEKNYYYAGHTVSNGSAGYQMAVNWDGEQTGPKGAFLRNKDDTQGTWGQWRELLFKDYAENTFATKLSLQTSGQAIVHWGNIVGAPSFSLNETLQNVTDRGNTTTNNIQANGLYLQDGGTLLSKGNYGSLRITTPSGYTEVGSQNGGWSHFETDRPSFFFGKDIHVSGAIRGYNTTGYFDGLSLGLQSGNGNGIRFWDSNSDHAIWMSDAGHSTFGGRVYNAGVNDYNMYFRITGYNRGFVFIPGNNVPVVQIDTDGMYNSKWYRSVGDGGWVNETYGGGWHMQDATWIRSVGAKSIYHDAGILRTDGTLQVGGAGSTFNAPNGGIPTINGNTIWHAGNDGAGSSLDADMVDGLHAADLVGNWGQITNHSGTNDFNGINRFGSTFINGGSAAPANGPGNGTLNQYYSWAFGLGAEYGVGSYNLQMAMGRPGGGGTETAPYLYRRFQENASYTSWTKIAAGYADNAGALNNIDAARFVYGTNGSATIDLVGGANLNNINKSGFYNGYSMVNAPSADWYNVIHSEYIGATYGNQIAQKFTGNTNEVNVFLRTQANSVWGPWREIWHTGNLTFSITADAYKLAQRDGSGQLIATGFYQSSLLSLKENIQAFDDPALPLINSLIIKAFNYKDDKEKNQHFGIIADNSDWHFATRKQDRFDTNSSLAIAIKAIQELSKEKEQLQQQVDAMEERLKRLEKLLQSK